MEELVDKFIEENNLRFEGDTGVKALEKLCQAIGYIGNSFAYGSPLESFLSDNQGACKALVTWIANQNVPEWQESLESELPEKEEGE